MHSSPLPWLALFVGTISTGHNYRYEDFIPVQCHLLPDCATHGPCLDCQFPRDCRLNEEVKVNCTTVSKCQQKQSLQRMAKCRFCWQTDPGEHSCPPIGNCSSAVLHVAPVKCIVHHDVICLGKREFYKNVRCNWTSGHSWAKALFLSIIMGGFGVDRFYLGLWKSGIGKLFSFGGLGVWTVVDVVLIATGYIRPADGSHYV